MHFINDLNLAKRLGLAFAIIILIILSFGLYAFRGLTSLEHLVENMALSRIPDLTDLATISTERLALRTQTVLIYDADFSDAGRDFLRDLQDQRSSSLETVARALASFKSRPRGNDTGRAMLRELEEAFMAWRGMYDRLDNIVDGLESSRDPGEFSQHMEAYRKAVEAMIPESERLHEAIEALWENNTVNTSKRAMAAHDDTVELKVFTALMIVLIVGFCIVVGWVITRSISHPIAALTRVMVSMGQGDMRSDLPAQIVNRKDEVGTLAKALNATSRSIRDSFTSLTQGMQTLSSAATELLAIAEQNASGAGLLHDRSRSVASAAEEMTANSASVAAGMEQTTTNLTSVASATEEMTATINEIADNTERARSTTTDAGQRVDDFSRLMRDLGSAAQEIGKVTDTINEISNQTNLLALNATIEAARAGAAGKGFAVVANEIKELARQTATATEEIQTKIGAIQSRTGNAVEDVGQIVSVIRQVNETVTSIAAAIEQQSAVTREVAGNISQASQGVAESTRRSSEMALAAQSVSSEIASVNQTAVEMSSASQQTSSSARELSQLSEDIRQVIGRFKV